MSHIPVNHPLQPLYRTLGGMAGVFVLVFGIVGLSRTAGDPLFDQGDVTAFGLHLNLAFAIISVAVGLVLVTGAAYGSNADHYINLVGGGVFLVAGVVMMLLLQTDANFLNFRMSTCIVSFVIGTVLMAAGLYGRTGPADLQAREEQFRQYHGGDPTEHRWAFHGAPPRPQEDHPDGHRFA
jgi:hypothetical protein